MKKLTGIEYIEHWRQRMARGPLEAGTVENGNDTWAFIEPLLPEGFAPKAILEYGCAYGRMMRHLHVCYPEAQLYGVDLSGEALDHLVAHWPDSPAPNVFNQNVPPTDIRVDMIFTCTVLQHVTDDSVLRTIAAGFRKILNPGGYLVFFENVNWGPGQGGAHMREFAAADYMHLFPEMAWNDCGKFMHVTEAHELMIGQKPLRGKASV
jgi:SAM-dependent methyltransferase